MLGDVQAEINVRPLSTSQTAPTSTFQCWWERMGGQDEGWKEETVWWEKTQNCTDSWGKRRTKDKRSRFDLTDVRQRQSFSGYLINWLIYNLIFRVLFMKRCKTWIIRNNFILRNLKRDVWWATVDGTFEPVDHKNEAFLASKFNPLTLLWAWGGQPDRRPAPVFWTQIWGISWQRNDDKSPWVISCHRTRMEDGRHSSQSNTLEFPCEKQGFVNLNESAQLKPFR